mgnify:CR=1 FL=1
MPVVTITSEAPVATKRATSRFQIKSLQREEVVVDRTTGLMWQQAASAQPMLFRHAQAWIENLNKCGYAGFHDWRLPSLTEAMTLMEQAPNEGGLYIHPIFNVKQRAWMWTSERGQGDLAWYVNFNYGYSQLNRTKSTHNTVRAVRLRF